MADNDIVRRGYMNVVRNPQGGMLGRVLSVTSRRQWVVLRRESGGSSCRIEIYRSEDQSGGPVKTISISPQTLRNVEIMERKKAFLLVMYDESCMFQCNSRADMEDWYRDIQYYNSGHRSSSVSSTGSSHGQNGEVYEVIPDDETFRVRLRKAKTLAFNGACLLEVLRDFERNLFHIGLFTEEELPRLIVKWQIDHIRQYGSNNMAFKFESGSKSSTGVDWFVVDTEPGCAVRIHRAVDYWAKHIVEQVKNIPGVGNRRSTLPSTPTTPDSCQSLGPNTPRGSLVSPPQDNAYMHINPGSRSPATVYAAPDASKSSKLGAGRINKPPAAPPTNSLNPTYMALNPNNRDLPGYQTYEGIKPRTGRPGSTTRTNGSSTESESQFYMGIDPRTRNSTQGGQYMGLKDARSTT